MLSKIAQMVEVDIRLTYVTHRLVHALNLETQICIASILCLFLLFALDIKQDNTILQDVFIGDEDLQTILQKNNVEKKYPNPTTKQPSRNKRVFQEMFLNSGLNNNPDFFVAKETKAKCFLHWQLL